MQWLFSSILSQFKSKMLAFAGFQAVGGGNTFSRATEGPSKLKSQKQTFLPDNVEKYSQIAVRHPQPSTYIQKMRSDATQLSPGPTRKDSRSQSQFVQSDGVQECGLGGFSGELAYMGK